MSDKKVAIELYLKKEQLVFYYIGLLGEVKA